MDFHDRLIGEPVAGLGQHRFRSIHYQTARHRITARQDKRSKPTVATCEIEDSARGWRKDLGQHLLTGSSSLELADPFQVPGNLVRV